MGGLTGGIQLPRQVQVSAQLAEGPAAFPSQLVGGSQLLVFGGLTKLEYAAIHLGGDVEKAANVLAECRSRQLAEQEKAGE